MSADFLDAAEANTTAFTVQALAASLRALRPGGIVSIPVSIRDFPVYALRVLGTARAALLAAGIADPAAYTVVYRSAWGARVLLSNQPWNASRIASVKAFCDERSFDVSWYPGEAVGKIVLVEQVGKTTLTMTVLYESREARDEVLKTPMEQGVAYGYDRLAELLEAL